MQFPTNKLAASEERLWLRAQRYLADNQLTAARITFENLLQRVPSHIHARVLLAGVILAEGHIREAATHMLEAARELPNDADVICMVAQCLLRVGEIVAARECLHHPEIARTRSASALASLAHVHQMIGEHEAALALMGRAKALGFDNPDFRYFRSIQLQFNGRIKEAETELETCLRMGPTYGRASLTLARLGRQTEKTNHLKYIREQLHYVPRGSEDHAAFEFAQYKELEDIGDYTEAWAALQRGNAIMYSRLHYDMTRERKQIDTLIERCSAEFLHPVNAEFEGPAPIFIIGLPRSGTTLLERIIGNHSMVVSAGELGDFPRQLRWQADTYGRTLLDETLLTRIAELDYANIGRRYLAQTQWRAQEKFFYVDKLPSNYLMAGFIHRALPQARILHMVRNPMDACFSNYKALFGGEVFPYSYDLTALAAHYDNYRRLMQHWHTAMPGCILDVSYTDLVNEPEAIAAQILAFCGLPYESGCVDITRNRTPSATLSSAQVREPIHARTLGEWRRYERQLEPLHRALRQFDSVSHI